MQLEALDAVELFSLTAWKSETGWTVGVQKCAGDMVRYSTRGTLSEAVGAVLKTIEPSLSAPPY